MEESNEQLGRRIHLLDEVRGFAIVCMVLHHLFYDIGYVLNMQWGRDLFDFFCTFQPVFWTLFIVISGICTQYSRSSLKRGLLLLCFALGLSVVTIYVMPLMGMYGQGIYFGILHCLAFCMILTHLLQKLLVKVKPVLSMAICSVLFLLSYNISSGYLGLPFLKLEISDKLYDYSFLYPLGIYNQSFESADYFAIFPWVFMFIFGAALGIVMKRSVLPSFVYKKHSKLLALAGRNSLWVYIFHQPVLYAILFLVKIFV